jgi:glycosyl transferase, family 25
MLVEPAAKVVADAVCDDWEAWNAQAARSPKLAAIPTFYINRDGDEARRAGIREYLRLAELPAERVPGVEGLAVPERFRDYFFTGKNLHSQLRPGEVGCYASHLTAMRLVVERNLPFALVLEDDAVLPADLCEVLANVVANLPASWDIVHICRDSNRAIKPVAQLNDGRRIVRFSRVPEVTTGYLVSRSGAQKFLRPMKRYWPIDTDFRQPWRFGLEIYGVAPTIVSASATLTSAIHELGNRSRQRRGLPLPTRYCWTGNPLHTPEGVAFNFRRLGPTAWALCNAYNGARRIVAALRLRPILRRLQLEGMGSRLAGRLAPRSSAS